MAQVLVIAEHNQTGLAPASLKVISAARELATTGIDVAVLAADSAAVGTQAAAVAGVDRVLTLERPENFPYLAAVWAPQVAALAHRYSHVLAPATTFGKDLLPRAAALLGAAALSDISAIDGPDRFRRPIYAGNAIASIEATNSGKPLFATIRTTAFELPGPQAEAPIEAVSSDVEIPAHTRYVERRGDRQAGPDLQSAATVVAGGRGLAGRDGVSLIEQLAKTLDAAVGASRAAVDSGWVSNELQVGQTGKIIAPKLYIGIGISGAIQHLTGIKDAGTIVAINNDGDAPICALADLVLVEDMFTALPALIERLESRREP